jgi:twitching motility protein PilT
MPWLDALFHKMVEVGASDLHMTTSEVPKFRLDGNIVDVNGVPEMTAEQMKHVLDEITPEANRAQFERDGDTDFAYELAQVARFRANRFRDRQGPGAVFRQIPHEILTAEQLGLPPAILGLCQLSKGLVLVTGPTGSGKSTTLAAMVDHVNKTRADHIITIEDPIEFVHQNQRCLINQREVHRHTESFKRALRAALREDPDIVLVGEMRDLETVEIAIETAETGHLVFGTLHTTTAASTVDRIIDQFSADRQAQIRTMLAASLKGVIAQTLCKKKGGGRVAALEILLSNTAIASHNPEGKTHHLTSMMQMGGKVGMRLLNDSLAEVVRNGIVEPREAYLKCVDKADMLRKFEELGVHLDPSQLEDPEDPSSAQAPRPPARAPLPARDARKPGPAPAAAPARSAPTAGHGGMPGMGGTPPPGAYKDPFDQFRQGMGK